MNTAIEYTISFLMIFEFLFVCRISFIRKQGEKRLFQVHIFIGCG